MVLSLYLLHDILHVMLMQNEALIFSLLIKSVTWGKINYENNLFVNKTALSLTVHHMYLLHITQQTSFKNLD